MFVTNTSGTKGQCEHDALTEPPAKAHGIEIPYFVTGDRDYRSLQNILTEKRWMKSLKYFTGCVYLFYLNCENMLITCMHNINIIICTYTCSIITTTT